MILEAAIIYGVGWALWKWWHPSKPAEAAFESIPHTSIEHLDGVGSVRIFDDPTAHQILINLAGAYTAVPIEKPLIGQEAVHILQYKPDGTTLTQPPKGGRAFDWIADKVFGGYYVVSVARSGVGPWSSVEGDNVLVACYASDLTSPDVINDFAIIAGPQDGKHFHELAGLETPELLKQLGA